MRALVAVAAALVFGHSVHGRPLRALEVGDRSSDYRMLVVGCIHGDECAGTGVVTELEHARPSFDLWLVPELNPDGHTAGTRQNAHGVDLNRNFPSEWRPNGRRGDAEYAGPHALSEPETRAARALILRLRPDVTIWLHQPQNLVRAWGPSVPAARQFARRAGMPFRSLRWPHGSAANWQNHRFPGRASFVVELPRGSLSQRLRARLVAAILDARR